MKVKELIKELQKKNPDSTVFVDLTFVHSEQLTHEIAKVTQSTHHITVLVIN